MTIRFTSVVDEELKSTDYRFIRVPSQIGKIVHKDFMPSNNNEKTKLIHWELEGKLSFAIDIFPYYYVKNDLTQRRAEELLSDAVADKTGIFGVYTDIVTSKSSPRDSWIY